MKVALLVSGFFYETFPAVLCCQLAGLYLDIYSGEPVRRILRIFINIFHFQQGSPIVLVTQRPATLSLSLGSAGEGVN